MPFYDSSNEYMPSKGQGPKGNGKSNQGSNKPSAKGASSNASKQKSISSMSGSAKKAANSSTKLNKNMKGENENSKMVNTRQKTKYPGKGNQPRGADSKASKQTSKAGKERNLDSGTFF